MYQSYFALLFLAIQKRIRQLIPELIWVDHEWSQLENYEPIPSILRPCLLIDITPTDFTNEGNLVQWSDVTVQFRLAFPRVTMPDTLSGQAVKFYELEHKIYTVLQGWQPTDTDGNAIGQPLNRLQVSTEKREDDIRVRTLLFNTGFEDVSASPVTSIRTATLNITT
jgi:hypothetical protein